MSEKATIKEIENRLNKDKADLAGTLADLTGRVAPGLLAEHVSDFIRENATPYAKRAEATIRENPVAFALAGAGLAWFLLGRKNGAETAETGSVAAAAESAANDWSEEIDRLRASATLRLRELESEAEDNAQSGRDFVKERADMISKFSGDVRTKLSKDLEDLSAEARKHVIEARERAYAAKLKAQEYGTRAATETRQFVSDHPVVIAVLGLAVGAAVLAAMPKEKLRNTAAGPYIDRAKEEAMSFYREEKKRAEELAARVKKEALDAARDVARSAEKEGSDLGDRLAEEFSKEASASVKNLRSHLQANGVAH
ncbi:hypothetical protein RPE78_06320 [Thioclava litoralis]|uniref:DUF3618 domain-containing protein n=1 Tax=Thioclava litoralis TaxID=3076557 RepID=A0ABZ1E3H2_9RHOB|nr:hypothetical protein RPE78_06320 [Thioclava sp. FTW29]